MMNLKGRDFLTLLDFTPEEVRYLLDFAQTLKKQKKAGISHRLCEAKNIALIFEKTSTRTRCAFEVAAADLGMGSTYLGPTGTQIGVKESIADTARVLASMYEAIEYRGFSQAKVEELARYADVPVYNGLTDDDHPTQVLADLLTIEEEFGRLKGIKLVFMGDCSFNMANALMIGCALTGMRYTACGPQGWFPSRKLTDKCLRIAEQTGAVIEFTSDRKKALDGADVIYTDIWVSMGEPEEEWARRIRLFAPYQVDKECMALAKPEAVFMHCLPSYHDMKTQIGKDVCGRYNMTSLEVADEVFEGPQSRVFEEAENRMHTIKAVIAATI